MIICGGEPLIIHTQVTCEKSKNRHSNPNPLLQYQEVSSSVGTSQSDVEQKPKKDK